MALARRRFLTRCPSTVQQRVRQIYKPSDHPTIRPSGHPTMRPSDRHFTVTWRGTLVLVAVGEVGLLGRLVGWFDVPEMGAAASPEVGVGDLVVADPVDVPETEIVGVLIEDAAGLDLDVVQAVARSVHTEDTDDLAGVHGVTVGRSGTGRKRRTS